MLLTTETKLRKFKLSKTTQHVIKATDKIYKTYYSVLGLIVAGLYNLFIIFTTLLKDYSVFYMKEMKLREVT